MVKGFIMILLGEQMHQVLDMISAGLIDRPLEIRKLKDKGRKVIGFLPGNFVPEELIYAAGAIPMGLIHGGNPIVVDASTSMTSRFLCPFARAQMGEQALKEQPYYNLVDTLVSPITCQHLRRVGDAWEYFGGTDIFRLGIPYKADSERGLEYYQDMLRLLGKKLEEVTGCLITNSNLSQAIGIYNRLRGLLKKISETRKADQPPISTLDFIKLNQASFFLDPLFLNEALARLLKGLTESQKKNTPDNRPRLLLTGPNVAYGDYRIFELVEECGGNIVVEELTEGLRYYQENIDTDQEPLLSLASGYLRKKVPPAFMRASVKKRFDFIMDLAGEFRIEGVIWYQLQYCDTYDMESYFFEKHLKKAGLNMLKLESDYTVQDRGQLLTRIEAFLETIEWRKQR
jgi:benzoyl-CoA reductase/2-hydroxyglutaryl-CoA dehydratase subunit BcrC/BadD/HgdB